MRSLILGLACALAVAAMAASPAFGQCAGGGGGTGGGVRAPAGGGMSAATTTASSSGQLLTSPGSWAYGMMLQARMRQAYAMQQSAVATQQAADEAELKARRKANWQQRRSTELSERRQRRELALSLANR